MSLLEINWSATLLPISSTINQAIRKLDEAGVKIVLIVDGMGIFVGTISDGDIRRGLLRGLGINSPIKSIVNTNACVVSRETDLFSIKQLMFANKIQQIPIVDDENRVVGLHVLEDIISPPIRSNIMVIMAGGFGKRLRPYTENCPKPMLHVAGKPMLERLIERAKLSGFNRFLISINYLGHIIEEYFGNGGRLNVEIGYIRESFPLGTAGSLGLIDPIPTAPFIVVNGDIISNIDYGDFLDFHDRNGAVASMAVKRHEWQNPYGEVQVEGMNIVGFIEKPVVQAYINSGVYALDPSVLRFLNLNSSLDMPSLFEKLRLEGLRTIIYPMHESWQDIGELEAYEAVNKQ